MNEYGKLKKKGYAGFAELYLTHFDGELKSDDEIDVRVYTKLVQLDTKLGTAASEQLCCCLEFTNRSEVIMVSFIVFLLQT